jgi:hypothetical protein
MIQTGDRLLPIPCFVAVVDEPGAQKQIPGMDVRLRMHKFLT